jgi:hypothetical protein
MTGAGQSQDLGRNTSLGLTLDTTQASRVKHRRLHCPPAEFTALALQTPPPNDALALR